MGGGVGGETGLTRARLLRRRLLEPDELEDAAAFPEHPAIQQLVGSIIESGCLNIPSADSGGAPTGHARPVAGGAPAKLRVDSGPAALSPTADGSPVFSEAHHAIDGARLCYGVTAVVATAPNDASDGVVVVPCTHNAALRCPDLRAWDAELRELHHCSLDEMGITRAVPLQPGDLMLAAATLMQSIQGAPQGLVRFEITPADAFPSSGPPQLSGELAGRRPAWLDELSDAELAVVGARTVGMAPKVAESDGQRVWAEPRPAADTPRGSPELLPPSVFTRQAGVDIAIERDLWQFDTFGYCIVKGVMDAEWLADANRAMDRFATAERIRLVPEVALRENGHVWPEEIDSNRLRNKAAPGPRQLPGEGAIHRPRLGGLCASHLLVPRASGLCFGAQLKRADGLGCRHPARRPLSALSAHDSSPTDRPAAQHDAGTRLLGTVRARGVRVRPWHVRRIDTCGAAWQRPAWCEPQRG